MWWRGFRQPLPVAAVLLSQYNSKIISNFPFQRSYHQKYLLRRNSRIFNSLNLTDPQVITSHVAARLNGYVNGHGRMADLLNEMGGWKLNEKQEELVRDAVANQKLTGAFCNR